MLAFMGLGPTELLILGALAAVAIVVVFALSQGRDRGSAQDRIAQLEAENQRLREEIEQLKRNRS
jgi:cell division protein FtsB